MRHETTTREAWLAARAALMVKEKAITRAGDALAVERRALPWIEIETDHVFQGVDGPVSLSELFDGRSQLFTKHFMLSAEHPTQCTGCSLEVDHLAGLQEHLNANDVSYVVIAPAPLEISEPLRQRMGWDVRWVSSQGSDYRRDVVLGLGQPNNPAGNCAFLKDDDGRIFLTWTSHARGGEAFLGVYRFFDVMPLGRREPNGRMSDWVRPRDMYGRGGSVSLDGRYHPDTCGCGGH